MRPVEVLYLTRRDTLNIVRDLIARAQPGAQVWLVSPWGCPLTRNLVNLKQMQRAAEAAAVELRLVSHHAQVRTLAREAGIPVHLCVPWGLRRYRRVGAGLRPAAPERLVRVEGSLGWWYRHRPRAVGVGGVLLALIVVAALLATLAGVAAALVPSATITLEPLSKPLSGTLNVRAISTYRELDEAEAIIPARYVQVILEGRGEVPATGRVDQPDTHASGEVIFINKTTDKVRVPRGTIVRTGSGISVRFATVADIDLPPALFAQTKAGIRALDPGPTGNVRPLSISIVEGPVARMVDVLNDAPIGGGTNKQVPTVAVKDIDALRDQLKQRLQQEAYTQLVAGLMPGEFIPLGSVRAEVMAQKEDQVLGQQTDKLTGSMKVVVPGLAVDGASLGTLAWRFIEKQAGAGYRVLEDSLTLERSAEVRVEKNVAHFSITVSGVAVQAVDMERVKRAVRGTTLPEARAWIKAHVQLQGDPQISLLPEQWERMPLLPARTEVRIVARRG